MAQVQIIILGMPTGTVHETGDEPVVLQFSEEKDFEFAEWIVPTYPGYLPAGALSEIRVLEGGLMTVVIDGPEGFRSGPHQSNWIRGGYPRGKLLSILETGGGRMTGVSVDVVEGSLLIEPVALGGPAAG
jgi:hypothetical protein